MFFYTVKIFTLQPACEKIRNKNMRFGKLAILYNKIRQISAYMQKRLFLLLHSNYITVKLRGIYLKE